MEPQQPDPNQIEPILLDRPSFFRWLWQHLWAFKTWGRRQKFITGLIILLLVGVVVYFAFFRSSNNSGGVASQNIGQAPTTVASPLTGVQVTPALAARPVTAVMIENSTDARPQSGLDSAGTVFEAVAEGGITRFVALFQEARPSYIGPVRSVRPYYLDWVAPFQASVAHVGGSPDALRQVRGGMRDLDEFFNANNYWRINSRFAPHNVYTSFAKLDALNKSKGYKTSNFTPWPRKAEAPSATPTVKTIHLTLSGFDYDVSYTYNQKTNSYYRSEGGAPHMEVSATGKRTQIHPKVVIAMAVPLKAGALDASGAYYSDYSIIGRGLVDIFQDGRLTRGTWIKKGISDQLSFVDANGQSIALDPGQTWVTAVTSGSDITHSTK